MSNLINSLSLFLEKVFSAEPSYPGIILSENSTSLPTGIDCLYFLSYKEHRDLLIGLKYGDDSKTARISGALYGSLARIQSRYAGVGEPLLIIPLPQSRMRVLRRGFNQTRRLLSETLRHDKEGLFRLETDNLVKIRDTKKQALLSRAERLTAQKGAFAARHTERLEGKTVFLFDDIVTTGASLAEARKTLLNAGAKEVICIALAH